jgi:hypothetical protein
MGTKYLVFTFQLTYTKHSPYLEMNPRARCMFINNPSNLMQLTQIEFVFCHSVTFRTVARGLTVTLGPFTFELERNTIHRICTSAISEFLSIIKWHPIFLMGELKRDAGTQSAHNRMLKVIPQFR